MPGSGCARQRGRRPRREHRGRAEVLRAARRRPPGRFRRRQSSALADQVNASVACSGARDLRYQHRLDDQRGRHRDAGEHATRAQTATAASAGRGRQGPAPISASVDDELARQRVSASRDCHKPGRRVRCRRSSRRAAFRRARVPRSVAYGDHADLEQAERAGEAKHDGDQSRKSALGERAEQAAGSARLDAPSSQRRRAQEEQRADAARRPRRTRPRRRLTRHATKSRDQHRPRDEDQLDQDRLSEYAVASSAFLGEPPPEIGAHADRDRRKRRPRGRREQQGRARMRCARLQPPSARSAEGNSNAAGDQNAPRAVCGRSSARGVAQRREADDIARGRGTAARE